MSEFYELLETPKSEIRLLLLHPAQESTSEIQCTLSKVSLNANPRYFALSYVWGDPNITHSILANGCQIRVTVNLVSFLQQWRNSCKGSTQLDMPLWIDALCINQRNDEERSSQVALMGSIYRKALRVLSWLGSDPITEHLRAPSKVFRGIAHEIKTSQEFNNDPGCTAWVEGYKELFDAHNLDDQSMTKNFVWDALVQLTGRPYWTRAWIIQEIGLAREILLLWHNEECLWDDIRVIYDWLRAIQGKECPAFLYNEAQVIQWNSLSSSNNGLEVLLKAALGKFFMARDLASARDNATHLDLDIIRPLFICNLASTVKARDSRDKVYSFLSLTELPIHPDYKSKTTEEVYEEFAAYLVDKIGNRILHYGGLNDGINDLSQPLKLRSWIPDLRSSERPNAIRPLFPDRDVWARKPSDRSLRPPPLHSATRRKDNLLVVSGILLDYITVIDQWDDCTENFKFCCKFLTGYQEELYPTGIPQLQALFRLLCSTARYLEEGLPGIQSLESCGHVILRALLECEGGGSFETKLYQLSKLGLPCGDDFSIAFRKQFLGAEKPGCSTTAQSAKEALSKPSRSAVLKCQMAMATSSGRTRFRTMKGYLGYGHRHLLPGDCVCLFPGCPLPVILRKVNSHYLHISTSFVLGLMNGEILKSLDDSMNTLQEFEIY